MPRRPRIQLDGVPLHIVQRGHNREPCFFATLKDAENNFTTTTHDAMGNVLSITDARNAQSAMTYDPLGRLLTLTQAKGTPDEAATTHTYDKTGNRKTVSDALGRVTQYQYDNLNRLVKVIDAKLGETRMTYDAEGRKTEDLDADNVKLATAYDGDGRLQSTTDGAGTVTTYLYGSASDGQGGLLAALQYPTYREDYQYDYRNRRLSTTRHLNLTTKFIPRTEYDASGNPVKETDAKGNVTASAYDRHHQLQSTTDAAGGVTGYEYDTRSNLITVTDAKGAITRYAYDKAGRKIKETRPGGEITLYTYDGADNLTGTTAASGRKRTYTFDAQRRPVKEEHYNAGASAGTTAATVARTIVYTYDKASNLSAYNDTETSGATNTLISAGTYTYDERNRQTSQTIDYGAFSKTHRFAYTAAGRSLSRTDPGASAGTPAHTLAYDSAGRVNKISLPTGAGDISVSGYTWNQMNEKWLRKFEQRVKWKLRA